MARLPKGAKQRRARSVQYLLRRCRLGLTEQEIAQELGLHRRTVNNYLRQLNEEDAAYREGTLWFPG